MMIPISNQNHLFFLPLPDLPQDDLAHRITIAAGCAFAAYKVMAMLWHERKHEYTTQDYFVRGAALTMSLGCVYGVYLSLFSPCSLINPELGLA